MIGMRRWATLRSRVCWLVLAGLGVWLGSGPDAEAAWGRQEKDKEQAAGQQGAEELPKVKERVKGLERREGFLTLYLDARAGKVWLELPPPAGEGGEVLRLLYSDALTTGLGSNPVGLDRGQLGPAKVLRVRRLGPRVLFEEVNLRFRALAESLEEQRATAESFATSVLWAGDVGALDEDGRSLVDLTTFLVRDAHGVVGTLRDTGQGEYLLDTGRSAVDFAGCLAFPDNVELEAVLTYTTMGKPGELVREAAPSPAAVTLVQHHSLIRLPDNGYRPRRADPRTGSFSVAFRDYSAPLGEPLIRRWLARHRLRKTDPAAERSPVVEPLVYYVDPGIPEPVRSAVVEGTRWWAEAFDRAGLVDAFRVELLPPGAHPLDVRYNVVQWVHRSTRGWSYGGGIIDPRTGEILKGHVNLGSLRVRQDILLFEGLAGTERTGTGAADDPIQLALARIRQLAAHEVGHTLGFDHNFAASTYGGRASVMDYPAPLVTATPAGVLDFSQAYAVGVGSWDVHAVRYAYGELPPGVEESAALEEIARAGLAEGLLFLSDADARPPGAAEPRANLWDNGEDPVAALVNALEVRRIALAGFGRQQVRLGTPLAELEEVLAPVYFHHRYQLEAAVKVVGGMEYNYAVRGDGQWATRIVPAARQEEALTVILGVLAPERLDLPESLLELLAPRAHESARNPEMFASSTAPAFDALGAARTAADQVVEALLQPERLARLVDFHRRDPSRPGVAEVLTRLIDQTFTRVVGESPRHLALRQTVQRVVVDALMDHAASEGARPDVRAHLEWALRRVRQRLVVPPGTALAALPAHEAALAADVERFFARLPPARITAGPPAAPPPGSPIGGASPASDSSLAGCSLGG